MRARELLIEFADFTRYSFRTAGEYTTLQDELTNIERYVRLEKARFGDRLNIKLQIAPEVLSVVLPFLALQPLVENAVRHGLASKPNGGTITITAENAGAECVIIVEDDGVGMDPSRLHEDLADAHQSGAHVGLGNVDDRMRSAFGDDFGLVVDTNIGAGHEDHAARAEVPGGHPGLSGGGASVGTRVAWGMDALRLPDRLASAAPGRKLGERGDDGPVVSLVRLHGVITAIAGPRAALGDQRRRRRRRRWSGPSRPSGSPPSRCWSTRRAARPRSPRSSPTASAGSPTRPRCRCWRSAKTSRRPAATGSPARPTRSTRTPRRSSARSG